MKKPLFRKGKILIILLFLFLGLKGQTGLDIQDKCSKIIPPSPIAAGLVSLMENSMNYSTGASIINIPIYTIKIKDFELPIKLVYKSNGIKVDQISSPVGLGWNLEFGGLVTRSVRGNPDDRHETDNLSQSHLGLFYSASYVQYLNSSDPQTVSRWDANFANGLLDNEPDIFYFNVPGYSGQFFFDNARKIHLTSKDNIKIDYSMIENSPISSFTITTPDGNIYILSTLEKTSTNLPYDWPYNSSWFLTKIITQTGEITFLYNDEDISEEKVSGERKIYYKNEFKNWNKEAVIPKIRINGKRIQSINWSEGNITFDASLLRQDLDINSADTHNAYAINGITVRNIYNKVVKKIELTYDYFDNSNTAPLATKYLYRRLKLTSLLEDDENGINKIPYTFFYNSYSLPNRNSQERDYWGYYNDNNATTLVPNLWFYPGGGLNNIYPSQYSIFKRDNYTGELFISDGADRNINESAIKAGILEEIQYPTGGKLKLLYVSNNFYFDGKTHTGGGIRVSEEQLLDNGIKKSKLYFYNSKIRTGESSGLVASLPNFAYQRTWNNGNYTNIDELKKITFFSVNSMYENGMFGGADVIYEDVTIKENNNGRKELKFDVPEITNSSFCLKSQGACFLNISPSKPLNNGSIFREAAYPPYGPYYYHYWGVIPVNDYLSYYILSDLNWNVGQLLDEKIYSELSTDNPIKETVYKYDLEQIESFPAHRVDFFDFSGSVYRQSYFNPTSPNFYVLFYFNAISKYNNIAGIKKLKEKTEYIYDLGNTNQKIENKVLYSYNDYFFLKEESTQQSNGLSLETSYKYPLDYPSTTSTNVCEVNRQTCLTAAATKRDQGIAACPMDPPSTRATCVGFHTSTYDNAVVQCQNNYNNCSLSDQQIITEMQNKNMINVVIEEQNSQTKNSIKTLTGGIVNKYRKENSLIVPSEKYSLEINNPSSDLTASYINASGALVFHPNYSKKLTYDKYDAKGNTLQYHLSDNISTCFIWSYNGSMPVAKGDNVTYDILNAAVIAAGATNIETFWSGFNNIATDAALQTTWKNFNTALRSNASLANAQVTTYTYSPLVGMTSQTDSNGITTYYEYDGFGRLKNVRDKDQNILKHKYYHYYSSTSSDSPTPVIQSTLSSNPNGLTFGSLSDVQDVAISSNTTWTATKSQSWITLVGTSGTGNSSIGIRVSKLISGTRIGYVTLQTSDGKVSIQIEVYQDSSL